jgi:uroporphyrin-3 C-methyltransferase
MTDQLTPEEKPVKASRSFGASFSIFISVVTAVVCITGFAYCYLQVVNVDKQFAQMNTVMQKSEPQDISGLQNTVNNLQQSMQKSQTLSAQQEQLITEWRAAQSGDLNKWHIAQARYLISMANDQLQYMHNVKLAIQILQQADKELQSSQDAVLLEVRKSLASDIANLQALQPVDVTAVFLQLNALNNLVDKLPLPLKPLQQDQSQQTAPVQTSSWKAGLESAWAGLNKIVIIRKNDASALPLVLPDEKIFLYQNLHAQLDSASWGLLHDNAAIYTASLERARAWIQQYFLQDAPETKNLLQQLAELQKMNIQPAVITLSNTLQLFDGYLAQIKTGQ